MSRGLFGIPPPQSMSVSWSSWRPLTQVDEHDWPSTEQERVSNAVPKVEHSAPEPVGVRKTGRDRLSMPNVVPHVDIQVDQSLKSPSLQSRFEVKSSSGAVDMRAANGCG